MTDSKDPAPRDLPIAAHIQADRACIHCGFNLYGQPVTKEPHYGLALARCPECGTAAALQQYPAATHLVNRYSALLSGVYMIALIVSFVITASSIGGFAQSAAQDAAEPLTLRISELYEQDNPTTNGSNQFWVFSAWIDGSWIDNNLAAVTADFGPRLEHIGAEFYSAFVVAVLASVPFGIFWSLALLGARRTKAALVGLLAIGVASVFILAVPDSVDGGAFAEQLARSHYEPLIVPIVLGASLVAFVVGVFIARPIARWTVVAALPPRSRVPFGVLWTRDGKAPPSPNLN